MRKILFFLLTFFIFYNANAQEALLAKNPEVITGKLISITKPLRDFTPADKMIPDVIVRDEDGIIGKDEEFEEGSDPILYPTGIFSEDPALQKNYPSKQHNPSINRAIIANFAGMPYQPLNPPDPTMCAGPNHVIQMINGASGALLKVFNKSGGQVVAQKYLDAITGKGGLGDPIAQYDQLADRFMLTEFANKPETGTEGLIVAITQTSDPAGSWYVYFFSTGNTFPDYPKFSVWPDAYYATTNDFANASSYSGSSAYALERAAMIAGSPTAKMQKFVLGTTNKFFSMCPVGLEGTSLPPAGTGGLIAYMADDAWTSTTSDVDSIGILEFKVDFTTPANTRITTKASMATVAYKSDICTATRGQCITQPGTSIKVEALHQKIMDQPIYRNFAGYEGIVMSHVADKGSNISGVRWYELHKTTGNWGIYQQSTYAPDNTHRWLPGICYDINGNIALAYNVSSSATGVFPGARYTGRQQCDPLNQMTYSEAVIIAGSASNGSTRYGDYNQLVCDPDGVTFWFTCEYNAASTWSTRIASFTLDPCNVVACGDPTGLTSSAITTTSATVAWTAVTNAVSYDVDYKLTSAGTWTNAATAITTTSFNVSGLTTGTTYDWRVRANCSSASGNYVAAQFTTLSVCNPPSGLTTSSITSSGANISWSSVSGANSYAVDYRASSSSTWINVATATTSTSATLSGLAAATSYDWRVRSNCSSGNSSYSSLTFTTASGSSCTAPSGLTASPSPTTGYVSWTAVSGGNSYDVDYKATSSSMWINVANAIPGTYSILSNLAYSTSYDWRVRTNCTSGNSSYSTGQFTTAAASGCIDPTGLASTVTTNSANLSWNGASGSTSYRVDYRATNSGTWKTAVSSTTATTVSLSGLSITTSYDWRVRSFCSSGSSGFSIAQFTTAATSVCNAPTGLTTSAITNTSANVSWSGVSGGNNYDVDYKATSSSTWINVVTATTATSASLSGLSASTSYDWRVRTNCSSGSSSYSMAQFTTTAVTGCPDQYEPNNTFATPAPVGVGVNINAQINAAGDNDYYTFNNTASQKKVLVTLSNLPDNYDMQLLRSDGFVLRTSQNTGTTDESFIYNTVLVGTFTIYVYGSNGAFNNTQCYTLNIQLSATNFSAEAPAPVLDKTTTLRQGLKVYPVPASNVVNVSFDAYKKGTADIIITNQLGEQILRKTVGVGDGINYNSLDVSRISAGMYFLKVINGKEVQVKKLMIGR